MNKRPTLKDVAKAARVSITTVSAVVNQKSGGNVRISDATRQRIWEAVEELGYRPNLDARQMRTQQSDLIGFITDEIATTPFAVQIVKGAQYEAWKRGKVLLVVDTERDKKIEEKAIATMLGRRVDGIVYATMFHRAVEPHASILEVAAVLVDCYSETRPIYSIVPDEVQGGRAATDVLLQNGHRRIGLINVHPGVTVAAATGRLEGYRQALAAYDIPYDDSLMLYGNTNADKGYQHTMTLMHMHEPPTAIFCGTDRTAMGAYEALKELGLRIPEDVAVVGFDNQEMISNYLVPRLTTVALPHFEMGQRAIQHLLDISRETLTGTMQEKMSCPLIERESVRPLMPGTT